MTDSGELRGNFKVSEHEKEKRLSDNDRTWERLKVVDAAVGCIALYNPIQKRFLRLCIDSSNHGFAGTQLQAFNERCWFLLRCSKSAALFEGYKSSGGSLRLRC